MHMKYRKTYVYSEKENISNVAYNILPWIVDFYDSLHSNSITWHNAAEDKQMFSPITLVNLIKRKGGSYQNKNYE